MVASLPVLPARATGSDAGDAGPNFTESNGCGAGIAGPLRPQASRSGSLPASEVVYGPWGDFFGRTRAQVEGSLVNWPIPGSTGGFTARVHERTLPAYQQVAAALDAAAANGLAYPIGRFFSGFSWRTVGGATYFSNHALGNAVDLNTRANPYRGDNVLISTMPAWFVDIWNAAGFCWGGVWENVKDPMHFSWMGPRATPAYGTAPAPYPPITESAPWTAVAFSGTTSLPPGPGDAVGMADRSRDGAPELYRVSTKDGMLRVEAAGARSGFAVTGYRVDTAATASPGAKVLLGDFDGSAHADLWVVEPAAATTISVYPDAGYFEGPAATFTVPADLGGATLALADYDRDLSLDLFAVHAGAATRVEVWSGSSGFTTKLLDTISSIGDTTGWALLVGDHDVDGVPDLYAISRTAPALVKVAHGGSGFLGAIANLTTGIPAGAATRFAIEDYDGDGRDDIYAVAGNRVDVYLGGVRDPADDLTAWFLPDDPPPWDAGPDCTGPEPCDQIGLMDSEARWSIRDEPASVSDDVEFLFGNPGDVPMLGDWDCDGDATPGLYRRSDGFVYLRNSSDSGVADRAFFFGDPGDLPLAGDFNGDGCDTVSIYRPHEARVYIVNALGNGSSGLGTADLSYGFGDPGDKPFVGDFDGNGITDLGLHRESTGLVYYRTSQSSGPATTSFVYGDPGDKLVAGDWDGDGIDTVAVFRPADGNWYIKLDTRPGAADHVVHYHSHDAETLPIAGGTATSSR